MNESKTDQKPPPDDGGWSLRNNHLEFLKPFWSAQALLVGIQLNKVKVSIIPRHVLTYSSQSTYRCTNTHILNSLVSDSSLSAFNSVMHGNVRVPLPSPQFWGEYWSLCKFIWSSLYITFSTTFSSSLAIWLHKGYSSIDDWGLMVNVRSRWEDQIGSQDRLECLDKETHTHTITQSLNRTLWW